MRAKLNRWRIRLARVPGRGYSPSAWRSGVRLCRRATGQGISRPTVYRWCIGPRGKENLGAVFRSSGHQSYASENAPASRRRRLVSTVRSPLRSDRLLFALRAIQVAQPPIGDSPTRSMKIRERSKTRSGFIQNAGASPERAQAMCRNSASHANCDRPRGDTWPPARRPAARPPIPGGTRCRFSTCPTASLPRRGQRCAAPVSP